MSHWYTVSCEDCGDDLHIHVEWSNPPSLCKNCKADRAAKWYERPCEDCGATMKLHQDWDSPPSICKSCRQDRAARWYERPCEDCGATMKLHQDWDNPPSVCKSCIEKRAAKWYETPCELCRCSIRAHKDWDKPPRYCDRCKQAHAPVQQRCAHCDEWFEISTGTQINCRLKGWNLPKRCSTCRDLFKHKPFRTIREKDVIGNTVFVTYNSRGDLIGRSRVGKDWLGDRERHHESHVGKKTGTTRSSQVLGIETRTTRAPDGSVQSESYDTKEFLGGNVSVTRGGASDKKSLTRTVKSIFHGKHRETDDH